MNIWRIRAFHIIPLVLVLVLLSSGRHSFPGLSPTPLLRNHLESLPVYFIPNKGQWDASILFQAWTPHYVLVLTRAGIMFSGSEKSNDGMPPRAGVKFRNANASMIIEAVRPLEHVAHFFLGNDPSRWQMGLPTYQAVRYKNVYPMIDLEIYGVKNRIEYDWIVKPGGRPDDIHFECAGAELSRLGPLGAIRTPWESEEIIQQRPISYQWRHGQMNLVASSFKNHGEGLFGFEVGSFDHSRDLIIDPMILAFSTFLGGSDSDEGYSVAVDAKGFVYLAGTTKSSNFPLKSPYQGTKGAWQDAFVAKLAPTGNALVFSTFFGGSRDDEGRGIAVDAGGAVYVTGWTDSEDFPTSNPYQNALNESRDAFVAKFNPAGNSLAYSTYIGGSNWDYAEDIALDKTGAAYIIGTTQSSDYPVLSPFQSKFAETKDAFISKFVPAGNALSYSTYLGGYGYDEGLAIAVDAAGAAYAAGKTSSFYFPVKNAFQAKLSGFSQDGFVTKIGSSGDSLAYSTYFGGSGEDSIKGIAVDKSGSAYVTGTTASTNFPTKNAFQKSARGYGEAFISKFSPGGTALTYSTYLGGDSSDGGADISVDSQGCAYIAGTTYSDDFPIKNEFQDFNAGMDDVFAAKFTPAGNALLFSTYLGGEGSDMCFGLAVDAKGAVYLTGETWSMDFPVKTPYQRNHKGTWDAFVSKFVVPEIAVTAPNGGESWKVSSAHNIKWRYTEKAGAKVKIELIKGIAVVRTVASSAAGVNGAGTYKWLVPSSLVLGGNYKIRISSKIYAACSDLSDAYFQIYK